MLNLPILPRETFNGILLPEPAHISISAFTGNAEQFPYHTNDSSFFNYNTGSNTGGYHNSSGAAVWTYTASSYTSLVASANVVSNVCWKHTDNTYYVVVGYTTGNSARLAQITNPTSANTATAVGSTFTPGASLTALNHLSFDGTNFQLLYNGGTRMMKISTAGAVVSDVALSVTCMDVLSTDIYLIAVNYFNATAAYPVGLEFKKGTNRKSIYPLQWAWRTSSFLRTWGDKVVLTSHTYTSSNTSSGAPYAFNKVDFIRFLTDVADNL